MDKFLTVIKEMPLLVLALFVISVVFAPVTTLLVSIALYVLSACYDKNTVSDLKVKELNLTTLKKVWSDLIKSSQSKK